MSGVAGAQQRVARGMKQSSLLELLLTNGAVITFPGGSQGCWVSYWCDIFMSFTAVFKFQQDLNRILSQSLDEIVHWVFS